MAKIKTVKALQTKITKAAETARKLHKLCKELPQSGEEVAAEVDEEQSVDLGYLLEDAYELSSQLESVLGQAVGNVDWLTE